MFATCKRATFVGRVMVAAYTVVLAIGAWAEDGSTISVTGVGEANAKPAVAEITAKVSGEAELAADAIVKYTNAKQRALKALDGLNMKELAVAGEGVTISNVGGGGNPMAAMMGGQGKTNVKPKIEVSETLRLSLSGIDKLKVEDLVGTLTKIIDAGKDAGLQFGGRSLSMMEMQFGRSDTTSLAAYKVADMAALEKQARAKAMENAKAQAEELAGLAGLNLGKVRSVAVVAPAATPNNPSASLMQMIYGMASEEEKKDANASTQLKDISVRASLSVVFNIEK